MTVTLLMPATINPGGTALTARADPTVRLADHVASLKRWIKAATFKRMVWCENSGWPLDAIQPLVVEARERGLELELISFQGQEFPKERGKGYGEMGIIAHALNTSQLLKEVGQVCKVSARYFVSNAAVLHNQCTASNAPDVICDLKKSLTVADSRFFAGTTTFFRSYLLPQHDIIHDTNLVYFEHALARAAAHALGDGLRWELPKALPKIIGITGTTDKPISLSTSKKMRYKLKKSMFSY